MHRSIIRKIETFTALSEEEKRALVSALGSIKDVGADEDIVFDGDRPSHSCAILEGFACRYKLLENGGRQIMSFQIAGDLCDLHSFILGGVDHSIGTLTPCKIACIPHSALSDIMESYPRINRALWRDTLIDAAIFREWMMGIGRRSAYTRIAHVLCEVLVKMRAVGLANGHECELPITQAELGDALGLSTVHVNRSLQELRGHRLLELRGGSLTVLNWDGLKKAGDFDPTYLHLDQEIEEEAA